MLNNSSYFSSNRSRGQYFPVGGSRLVVVEAKIEIFDTHAHFTSILRGKVSLEFYKCFKKNGCRFLGNGGEVQ